MKFPYKMKKITTENVEHWYQETPPWKNVNMLPKTKLITLIAKNKNRFGSFSFATLIHICVSALMRQFQKTFFSFQWNCQ